MIQLGYRDYSVNYPAWYKYYTRLYFSDSAVVQLLFLYFCIVGALRLETECEVN